MEQKKSKFRFRLNLFDCIVIVAAVAVAGLLLWSRMKPVEAVDSPVVSASGIQYTIVLRKTVSGTGALVQQGDALVDAVKNFDLGRVVESSTEQAQRAIVSEEEGRMVMATLPGYEDIYITVESTSTTNDSQVLLGSGYELRVGEDIYVRGPGYLGSGKVYAIERGN